MPDRRFVSIIVKYYFYATVKKHFVTITHSRFFKLTKCESNRQVRLKETKGKDTFFFTEIQRIQSNPKKHKKYLFGTCSIHIFAHEHNRCSVFLLHPTPEIIIKTNGYKLSAQTFLGLFGRTSVTYDWLIVALSTIDQS